MAKYNTSSKKNDKVRETKRNIERWILDEVKGQAVPLVFGGAAMTISSYANQLVPKFLGRLMDPGSEKNNDNNSSFSRIIILSIVGGGASFARTVSLNFVQDHLAGKFRMKAFEGLLTKRDLEWFHLASSVSNASDEETDKDDTSAQEEEEKSTYIASSMTPSEIGLILKDDVDCVAKTITGSVANLFRGLSSCFFGTYNMLYLNPNLFFLSVLVAPFVGTIAYISRKYTKNMLAIQHQAASKAAAFLDERLNHIMMVKMSSREEDEIHEYNTIQNQFISSGNKSAMANGMSMGSMFALSTASLCGILFAGGRSVQSGKMERGELVSFSSYSFLLALGSASIIKSLTEISKAREPAERVYSLIFGSSGYDNDSQNDNSNDTGDTSSPISKIAASEKSQQPLDTNSVQSIATENVSFAYTVNPSALVLRNISMKVSVGELVVIIGENGAGKSTIASLLAGLYTPTNGGIVVHHGGTGEKTNYKDLDSKMLSKLVQVVPQQPALFDTTILENVQYSCKDAPIEKVRQALTAANCDDFISKLEGGVEYQVGRNGKRLSGGQRQRIGLARALLADPVLLALDEPASALDAEGESAVSSAISACRASRKAMLLITHNPKALLSADRVVIMDSGTIQQEGTLFELKAKKSSLLAKLMPGLH